MVWDGSSWCSMSGRSGGETWVLRPSQRSKPSALQGIHTELVHVWSPSWGFELSCLEGLDML